MNTNYNICLDEDLKNRAFAVFESYGLSPAQAIKLFLNQVADTRSIPLSFNHHATPNLITQQAMQEARNNRQNQQFNQGYTDLDVMMRDIAEWQE